MLDGWNRAPLGLFIILSLDAALRNDERAWQEELSERRDWDATLGDGLADE
ncbi:MAG TPA: hypothetical protein VF306_14425 [Pirellulales bacterium]